MARFNIIRNYLFLSVLLCFSACDEIDEYPADISLNLELQADKNDNLSISESNFSLSEITLEAEKENGEKVTFRENTEGELLTLRKGETENLLKFNLPPAVYNYINIEIIFSPSEKGATLGMSGAFNNSNIPGNAAPAILFEHIAQENITLKVKGTNGAINDFVIKKDDKRDLNIIFDAGTLFETINVGQIIAADKKEVNGVNTIVINNGNNQDLNILISSRIHQAFSASF